MDASEWLVAAGGAALILWINWYFFLAERASAAAAPGAGGFQEVRITVRGGYAPSVVRVKRGVPVRLVFDRRESSSCSEEIVIPEFGIRRFLPANEQTVIELEPDRAGEYEFTCGMSMLRGTLQVEE